MLELKHLHAAGAGVAALSLAVAYFFMERHLLLEPCPLCILDRMVVAAMGVFFVAAFFTPSARAQKALWLGNVVALAFGFVVAGRHLWLLYRPPQDDGVCLSNSESGLALMEIIRKSFSATGDCSAVYWQFAGLSIPEQVFLLFAGFAALLAWQGVLIFRKR